MYFLHLVLVPAGHAHFYPPLHHNGKGSIALANQNQESAHYSTYQHVHGDRRLLHKWAW